jgi:hypothetical protein
MSITLPVKYSILRCQPIVEATKFQTILTKLYLTLLWLAYIIRSYQLVIVRFNENVIFT